MLLAGAKGHALEIVDLLLEKSYPQHKIACFDDVNVYTEKEINGIKLITSIEEAKMWLNSNNEFALATGSPKVRSILLEKLGIAGGTVISVFASTAIISRQNVILEAGLNVMNYCMISANVTIGKGTLINAYSSIHHDVFIGRFTEIAPGCKILGGANIGNNCFIGSGAVILPKIKVGSDAVVASGAVVTKDVDQGATVVGIPAKRVK